MREQRRRGALPRGAYRVKGREVAHHQGFGICRGERRAVGHNLVVRVPDQHQQAARNREARPLVDSQRREVPRQHFQRQALGPRRTGLLKHRGGQLVRQPLPPPVTHHAKTAAPRLLCAAGQQRHAGRFPVHKQNDGAQQVNIFGDDTPGQHFGCRDAGVKISLERAGEQGGEGVERERCGRGERNLRHTTTPAGRPPRR